MESGKQQKENLKWGVRQRLEFLERRLFWDGCLNRKDIMDAFGVSNLQATKDISLYQKLAPGNLVYDRSLRTYLPAKSFQMVLAEPSAEAMLAELAFGSAGAQDALSKRPPVAMITSPGRQVPLKSLRGILRAINGARGVRIYYQSMSRPEPVWRWIEPHALANDGLRWHVRAYCYMTDKFKDFLLSRVMQTGEHRDGQGTREMDEEWNTTCSILLAPHRGLTPSQSKVIEMDYGMRSGRLEVKVRRAMIPYLLQRLNLSMAGAIPSQQQVEVLNLDELGGIVSFGG